MSIYAYVGLPGSGKSYGVVANQVMPALRDGRTVVTNLALKVELLREVFPGCDLRTFQTSELVETPERIDEIFPPGCVAVIDEVWRLWPSGLKVDRIPMAFKSFLAEHRHRVDKKGRSLQIALVTQDLAQIAAFARQLVEQTFVHQQLGALGMRGRYRVGVYEGNVTGLTPPTSRRIAQNLGKYDEKVYRFYSSHTMSESEEGGADETPVDSRGNVWQRPALWLGLVGFLACLGFGGTWAYDFFTEPTVAVSGAVGDRHPATVAAPPKAAPSSTPAPATSSKWRVSGYVRDAADAGGGIAFLTDGTTREVVSLSSCLVSQWATRCEFRGFWVDMQGSQRDPISEPSGAYTAESGLPKLVASAP